uniref:Histone-lysine N-methyltransferase SETDB2 n=1 Tax=Chelydra serpentina TaxID=8475 RepID=A0A8C3TJV5_CHESE
LGSKCDAQMFWRQMEDERVDFIFEQVQNVLLSLKQKIKDGTATNEECFQALILADRADVSNLLTLTNEKSHSGNEDICSETKELPLKLCYQNHDCSNVCLANRPLNSYKGENPLKIPILCHFQRRHAKADSLSKSLDVNYKAPCGRSLRNFQDVQSYLLETECNFLFVDHFSFNTYVQLGRNTLNREALVFDFDISNGAESVPISFCNEVDSARLPYFKYRKASWPRGYYLNNFSSMFLDSSKCACLRMTAKGCSENSASPSTRASCGYRYKRLDGPVPSGIYECNLSCKCDRMRCHNRVAQHGIQVRLQVFNTDRKGWGVRCLDDIDKGTFVCTYSGNIKQCLKDYSIVILKLYFVEPFLEVGWSKSQVIQIHSIFIQTITMKSIAKLTHARFHKPSQLSIFRLAFSTPLKPNPIWNESLYKLQLSPSITNTAKSKEKRPSPEDARGGKSARLDDAHVMKQSMGLLQRDDFKEEKNRRSKQDPLCDEEAEGDETPLKNSDKENIYLLDATKEGNVGRFLNHSCCPNLFVQSVFVETHNRNFPWVAFFTNRHVKAGTELTWDYGYEAGSMPETEISCQCGVQKCRKKIL